MEQRIEGKIKDKNLDILIRDNSSDIDHILDRTS